MEKEKFFGTKGSIIFFFVTTVFMVILWYFLIPALNIESIGTQALILAYLLIMSSRFWPSLDAIWEPSYKYEKFAHLLSILSIAWFAIFLVLDIASSAMFQAQTAYSIAETECVSNIDEVLTDTTENSRNLPLIDMNTAQMLGDKKIAELKNASWYEVDSEYNLIEYHGQYYRLSALDYGGFWKFNKAKASGIPGYVLVPATIENGVTKEAELVTLTDPIRYSPGAFWSYDLRRHLRMQYPTYMFDTSFLEIDEEGTPFWVTGVMRPKTIFGTRTVESFILTNAQTGTSAEYSTNNAPEWIDHIYSLDYLMKIANWHYSYGNGFWNSVFSKTGVLKTSYEYRDKESSENNSEFANFFGYSSVVDANGNVCFYTGLTGANTAESNRGWLIIDISTGRMRQYDVVGAEESSAQQQVESLVQAQQWEATFPLPANIAGNEAYIMCLKGKAGLTQAFAICDMKNYSIAVYANTINEAIEKYLHKISGDITTSTLDDEVNTTNLGSTATLTRKIEAIYTAEIDGNTHFYYIIGHDFYRASIKVNELQIAFKVGDEVTITYYEDNHNGYYIVKDIK